jgi:hypothetical protein
MGMCMPIIHMLEVLALVLEALPVRLMDQIHDIQVENLVRAYLCYAFALLWMLYMYHSNPFSLGYTWTMEYRIKHIGFLTDASTSS